METSICIHQYLSWQSMEQQHRYDGYAFEHIYGIISQGLPLCTLGLMVSFARLMASLSFTNCLLGSPRFDASQQAEHMCISALGLRVLSSRPHLEHCVSLYAISFTLPHTFSIYLAISITHLINVWVHACFIMQGFALDKLLSTFLTIHMGSITRLASIEQAHFFDPLLAPITPCFYSIRSFISELC